MKLIPKLQDLLTDPRQAATIPQEAVPAMLGELESLKAVLWARLTASQSNRRPADKDRLLNVDEAADKLGMSQDYLYKHSKKLPFTVHQTLTWTPVIDEDIPESALGLEPPPE